MEIIEIKSAHSLLTSITTARPLGAHVYKLNCRQYLSVYQNWQRQRRTQPQPFGMMTLDFERIWITDEECLRITTAIKAASSPVVLD